MGAAGYYPCNRWKSRPVRVGISMDGAVGRMAGRWFRGWFEVEETATMGRAPILEECAKQSRETVRGHAKF